MATINNHGFAPLFPFDFDFHFRFSNLSERQTKTAVVLLRLIIDHIIIYICTAESWRERSRNLDILLLLYLATYVSVVLHTKNAYSLVNI